MEFFKTLVYNEPSFFDNTNTSAVSNWRITNRVKTLNGLLVLCLDIGLKPLTPAKINTAATMEGWIDPISLCPSDALKQIANNLIEQYNQWQPKARYKHLLDPCTDTMKKLLQALRKSAKDERILFHYNGHGVPTPTNYGEIWFFDETHTHYVPYSVSDLTDCIGTPLIYVFECTNNGIIMDILKQHGDKLIALGGCSSYESPSIHSRMPADIFTSCLTTPLRIAVRWHIISNTTGLFEDTESEYDLYDKIPGSLNDRETLLGQLNWIFTAISDTIAWNVLPKELFQSLYRQDLLVASLFRNYLLAERILSSYGIYPISIPALPCTKYHPLWLAWDLILDEIMRLLKQYISKETQIREQISKYKAASSTQEEDQSLLNRDSFNPNKTINISEPKPLIPTKIKPLVLMNPSVLGAAGLQSSTSGSSDSGTLSSPSPPPLNSVPENTDQEEHLEIKDESMYEAILGAVEEHPTLKRIRDDMTNVCQRFFLQHIQRFENLLQLQTSRNDISMYQSIKLTTIDVNVLYDHALIKDLSDLLPIMLQVLLRHHRIKALKLLGRFLDLGQYPINQALSVGIFPYMLKLLQSPSREMKPLLVYVWAKILSVDNKCQADLIKENGHKYFISLLADNYMLPEHRITALFCLTVLTHNFAPGQEACIQENLMSLCFELLTLTEIAYNRSGGLTNTITLMPNIFSPTEPQISSTTLTSAAKTEINIVQTTFTLEQIRYFRLWLILCLASLWYRNDEARWRAIRDSGPEKLLPLVKQSCAEKLKTSGSLMTLFKEKSTITQNNQQSPKRNSIPQLSKQFLDIPQTRAATVLALGNLISAPNMHTSEHSMRVDHALARDLFISDAPVVGSLLSMGQNQNNLLDMDASQMVKEQLVLAILNFVESYQDNFLALGEKLNYGDVFNNLPLSNKSSISNANSTTVSSNVSRKNMFDDKNYQTENPKSSTLSKVFSNSSIAINTNVLVDSTSPNAVNMNTQSGPIIPLTLNNNIYFSVWKTLVKLANEPSESVSDKARYIINEIRGKFIKEANRRISISKDSLHKSVKQKSQSRIQTIPSTLVMDEMRLFWPRMNMGLRSWTNTSNTEYISKILPYEYRLEDGMRKLQLNLTNEQNHNESILQPYNSTSSPTNNNHYNFDADSNFSSSSFASNISSRVSTATASVLSNVISNQTVPKFELLYPPIKLPRKLTLIKFLQYYPILVLADISNEISLWNHVTQEFITRFSACPFLDAQIKAIECINSCDIYPMLCVAFIDGTIKIFRNIFDPRLFIPFKGPLNDLTINYSPFSTKSTENGYLENVNQNRKSTTSLNKRKSKGSAPNQPMCCSAWYGLPSYSTLDHNANLQSPTNYTKSILTDLVYHNSSGLLFISGYRIIRIWDLSSQTKYCDINLNLEQTNYIISIAIDMQLYGNTADNPNYLACALNDNSIRIYNINRLPLEHNPIKTLKENGNGSLIKISFYLNDLHVQPHPIENLNLLSVCSSGEIRIWDMASSKNQAKSHKYAYPISLTDINTIYGVVAGGLSNQSIGLFNFRINQSWTLKRNQKYTINQLAFHPTKLTIACVDNYLSIYTSTSSNNN